MTAARWRVMLVVTREPRRTTRFPMSEPPGLPPLEVAEAAARLLACGAEVRVLDQDAEQLTDRVVRREVKLWRADVLLLHAGGAADLADPVPDAKPLQELLAGGDVGVPVLACGPLARRFGLAVLAACPRLSGALRGPIPEALGTGLDLTTLPGLCRRQGGDLIQVPIDGAVSLEGAGLLPAWHVLPLASYDGEGWRRRVPVRVAGDPPAGLARVSHAVRRAGAGVLAIVDHDLAADEDALRRFARGMSGAAPAIPWTCRVRADHVHPMIAVALAQGGCQEVLVTAPRPPEAPGLPPMDDPDRTRIESAVDAVRTTGMSVVVEHVVGRPGHSLEILAAWKRWFADRRMAVVPRVVVPGTDTEDLKTLAAQAGCRDNALKPGDVERAVRALTSRAHATDNES